MTVEQQQKKIDQILEIAKACLIPDFEGLKLRLYQNMEGREKTYTMRQKEVNDGILIVVRAWASVNNEKKLVKACDGFLKPNRKTHD